jgi:hypothetical protein
MDFLVANQDLASCFHNCFTRQLGWLESIGYQTDISELTRLMMAWADFTKEVWDKGQ